MRGEFPLKVFLGVAAGLTLLLGGVWLFFPHAMLASWSVPPDPVTVYMARRYGGLFFGYSAPLWLGRAVDAAPARRAILAGGLVVTSVMAAVSLLGALTAVVGPAVWAAGATEAVLAAGFAYCYARSR